MSSSIAKQLGPLLLLLSTCVDGDALADDVRPIQIQLREQEPGLFLVQWQVPKIIPVEAAPTPALPTDCEPEGEHSVRDQEATWIHRMLFRCESDLSGQTIGVDYPFLNATLSTVIRVSLLSGEEHARILAPGEDRWELPEGPPNVLQAAHESVLAGVEHVFDHWVHLVLVIAFALLGSAALAGFFTLGQLGAIAISWMGARIAPTMSELVVALAVVLLARQALLDPDGRRQISGLAAAAGVVHGLGLASAIEGAALALAVIGMDATLVVVGTALSLALARPRLRTLAAYGAGTFAVALGLALFFARPMADADRAVRSMLPSLSRGMGASGSQRLAPSVPDAPVQSFLAIEPFETRHEVLVRLRDEWTGSGDVVAVEDQDEVKARIAERIVEAASITIDGAERDAIVDRVDFVTIDPQGVWPRSAPVPEPVTEAFIGVTVVYLTSKTPSTATMTWTSFDRVPEVPVTLIDPESTQTALLTPGEPTMAWSNTLSEDPIPTVTAVAVEPMTMPLPLASVPLLAAAGVALAKRRQNLARVLVAVAVVAAPWGTIAVALPSSAAPSAGEARRILAGLLPNVYRAFEFRDESTAYDRLALTVTGETLTTIYLEHRRALEMEERGGARARVEAVEVQAVENVAPAGDGFAAEALWTVGGTVTHFGHRHFRENRYRAAVEAMPVENDWKIRTIDVLEEERVR